VAPAGLVVVVGLFARLLGGSLEQLAQSLASSQPRSVGSCLSGLCERGWHLSAGCGLRLAPGGQLFSAGRRAPGAGPRRLAQSLASAEPRSVEFRFAAGRLRGSVLSAGFEFGAGLRSFARRRREALASKPGAGESAGWVELLVVSEVWRASGFLFLYDVGL